MLTGRQLSCFRESKLPNSKTLFGSEGTIRAIHSMRRANFNKGCNYREAARTLARPQETGSTLPTIKRYDAALITRLTHTQTKAK